MARIRKGYVYAVDRDGRVVNKKNKALGKCGKVFGWWARVTITNANGERKNIKRWAETKTDADDLVTKLVADLKISPESVLEGKKTRLSDYLDRWLETVAKPRVSARTFLEYQDLLRLHIKSALGNKKLSELHPSDIQAVYAKMQDSKHKLSPRTVRYTHAVLSSALKHAVKLGVLVRNPASFVELPKRKSEEMQALSIEDAGRFLAAAAEDKWAVLFSLALTTGMRPQEYLALKWKDIDLKQGVLSVQRSIFWGRKGKGYSFGETKTKSSRRSIPISGTIVAALAKHKRLQAEERLKAGQDYENQDLIFATNSGGPLMIYNLRRRHFKPILKRAGLPLSIRLYDLRHSCATLLLSANENPKIVSERLGHASSRLTLDTYSHVVPSMQRGASDKLEEMLFNSAAPRTRKRKRQE